jgi:metal-responsive CopG/Arc/MetJ family transcriptional regulator
VQGIEPEYIPGTLQKRRHQVIVNVNIDEWEEFIDLCDERGVSRSEAVRRLVRRALRKSNLQNEGMELHD